MPYSRAELLQAVRTDHPEFKDVEDNKLFAAIAVDHPEMAQGISELQPPLRIGMKAPPGTNVPDQWPHNPASRTATEVMQDQAANVLKGIPQAVTGIPGTVGMAFGAIKDALSGNASGLMDTAASQASPITTPLKQAVELAKPGLVNAPGPDAPETAEAAQGAGALLGSAILAGAAPHVLPKVSGAWNAVKAKAAPYVTSPGLDAAAINKWMDVPAKEVTHGANPGQRVLQENLLADTKAATKAKVDSALGTAGKDIEAELKAADAQGIKIDAEHLVKDALDSAQAKLKSPTDAAFANRVKSTFDKILKRYPNIDDLSPSEAHALKKELGDSINWRSEGDDPLNDAFIQAYRDVNTVIKGSVKGMGPLQARWGDLYAASRNLSASLAEDVVGKGSGAAAPAEPPSPAWVAAKKLAPYAAKAALGAGAYGAYRYGRDLIAP
jgi:hypothetical protein